MFYRETLVLGSCGCYSGTFYPRKHRKKGSVSSKHNKEHVGVMLSQPLNSPCPKSIWASVMPNACCMEVPPHSSHDLNDQHLRATSQTCINNFRQVVLMFWLISLWVLKTKTACLLHCSKHKFVKQNWSSIIHVSALEKVLRESFQKPRI